MGLGGMLATATAGAVKIEPNVVFAGIVVAVFVCVCACMCACNHL